MILGVGDLFAAFSFVIFLFIVIGLMGIAIIVLRITGFFQLSSDIKKIRIIGEQQIEPSNRPYYQPSYMTESNQRGPSSYQNSYEKSTPSEENYQNSYEKQTTPEKIDYIFCNNCGATIPSSSMYCENCGAKIQ